MVCNISNVRGENVAKINCVMENINVNLGN